MESKPAQTRAGSGFATLVVCKPAFSDALRAEIAAKRRDAAVPAAGSGWLTIEGIASLPSPWVFERQRLPGAIALPGKSRRELAQAAWAAFGATLAADDSLAGRAGPWTVHAFAADPTAENSLQKRAAGIGAEFLECAEPRLRIAYRDPETTGGAPRGLRAVQLCLTEAGLFGSCGTVAELSSPWPGGVHRMRGAGFTGAPSRSAMKVEEALELFGETPAAGQSVVDLGAAPGGWTLAFLRRGCHVVAVDRASLRLDARERWEGSLEHRREDGLHYRPDRAVDWLLSDMLVAPGITLGLLRKWLGEGWTRRFIVNVKLPQKDLYLALRPLERFLAEAPGVRATIRQLHHDRREVTAWGVVSPGKPSGKTPRDAARPPRPRKGR